MIRMRIILNTLLCAASLATLAAADTYTVGSKVAPFTTNDQHGAAFTLDTKSARYLLVSFDMETGKKANAALDAKGKDFLPGKNAVYVANIHGMPGIGRMFAMPKMRKYSHRIILADNDSLLSPYPQQAGKVTVIKMTSGKVESIRYWDPATQSVEDQLK